mmetsp:Transcript_134692/g.319260  ORF Transcript_134692/g.319260 Transcript_134692/m.319260 type:complete len:268 (-) Transcript_134692:1538-2341(-)
MSTFAAPEGNVGPVAGVPSACPLHRGVHADRFGTGNLLGYYAYLEPAGFARAGWRRRSEDIHSPAHQPVGQPGFGCGFRPFGRRILGARGHTGVSLCNGGLAGLQERAVQGLETARTHLGSVLAPDLRVQAHVLLVAVREPQRPRRAGRLRAAAREVRAAGPTASGGAGRGFCEDRADAVAAPQRGLARAISQGVQVAAVPRAPALRARGAALGVRGLGPTTGGRFQPLRRGAHWLGQHRPSAPGKAGRQRPGGGGQGAIPGSLPDH